MDKNNPRAKDSLADNEAGGSEEMESRYRGLLEAAPDAMVVVNPGGEIVLLNMQAERQFGYRRDELVGQPVTLVIPDGFAERLTADALRSSADALAQKIGTGIELLGRRRDRSEFPIEIMLSPLNSAEGILMTAAIRDISVRKNAEKHLARMEARYRGLLEAAPDAMVVVNPAGEIVLLNMQAERQFGYRRDVLLGQPVKNIIPDGFAERLTADALRSSADALAQRIGTGIELLGRRNDGSEFPIEIMLSPLESEEGILVTAAIRDISARKKAEGVLKTANHLLTECNQELEAFTYTAAHDLRAPLRHMHGFVSLLGQAWYDKLDDDGRHCLDKVSTSAKQMGVLLDDLLNFSRVGRLDLHQNQVHLNEVVKIIRQELEPEWRDRQLTWEIGELPEVAGDATLLHQALFNLISNAVKYTRKRGDARIQIGCRNNTGNSFTLFVCDNGAGFDMNYVDKLFHVFQRLHKDQEFEGTGIGLAIVRRIVERHGGQVWAEGALGKGATFYVSLPDKGTKQRMAQ